MPGFVSEAVEALKAMLPELQQRPSQERVRQMAKFLGEPQKVKGSNLTTDHMFRNVRKSVSQFCSDAMRPAVAVHRMLLMQVAVPPSVAVHILLQMYFQHLINAFWKQSYSGYL